MCLGNTWWISFKKSEKLVVIKVEKKLLFEGTNLIVWILFPSALLEKIAKCLCKDRYYTKLLKPRKNSVCSHLPTTYAVIQNMRWILVLTWYSTKNKYRVVEITYAYLLQLKQISVERLRILFLSTCDYLSFLAL